MMDSMRTVVQTVKHAITLVLRVVVVLVQTNVHLVMLL
jgi:hypothetical protein